MPRQNRNPMKKYFSFFFLIIVFLLSHQTKHNTANAQIQVDVGGYAQTWVIFHDYVEDGKDVSGYRLRRGRIFARSRLGEHFSATTWYDFAGPDRNLLDFHLDAHIYPWLNIRLGQFIMSGQTFDTARLVSSRLIFHERAPITTQLATTMGYDAFRDIGIMVYGNYGKLWYGIHTGNGTGRFTQAGTHITQRGLFEGLHGVRVDVEVQKGLFLGGHASINSQKDVVISNNPPRDILRKSWSLRLMTDGFGLDRVFTETEYASGERDDDQKFTFSGFYTQAGFKITPDWHVLARYDRFERKPATGDTFKSDDITLGSIYYVRHNRAEIARIGVNYRFGQRNPGSVDNYILLAWLQVRFIP